MIAWTQTLRELKAVDSDHLSPWWWLIFPLAAAVVLLITGRLPREIFYLWVDSETRGALEISQLLLSLAGLAVAVRVLILPALRRQPWLYGWVGIAALGCLYISGEEASWGQHYFAWNTPETWKALNDQEETNLHNLNAWFDQKPRLMLELGVIFGGIVIPLLAISRPSIRENWYGVILPPLICLPSALLAEFSKIAERLLDLLPFHAYLFFRASEVQEFFFYYFILLYLIVLHRRLRHA